MDCITVPVLSSVLTGSSRKIDIAESLAEIKDYAPPEVISEEITCSETPEHSKQCSASYFDKEKSCSCTNNLWKMVQ